MSRRSLLLGAGAAAVVGAGGLAAQRIFTDSPGPAPVSSSKPDCAPRDAIVYGSSAATWQLSDAAYRRLFEREASLLFTEDDLLWYRLRPTPDSGIDFSFGDKIVGFAERNGMLVFGAHLVWDEGFGEGWTDEDLWGMNEPTARRMLFGTARRTVEHYRGRVDIWSVVNEAIGTDGVDGLRTDVPWYATIGPAYVSEAFHIAREADPHALLVLNEFGFETTDDFGADPEAKRGAALQVIDALLDDGVPVDALGIQAHLLANDFADEFDPDGYRRFLGHVADRDLVILITELDVLDDGLPPDPAARDRGVAETYQRYLGAALEEPAIKSVINFGLSDRYTWLQEDFPRDDGVPRRPLPFDEQLDPKPAHGAVQHSLQEAPPRCPLWDATQVEKPTAT